MARRDLLTGDERRALFGVPLDHASLAKHYTVADEDRPLIEAKRGDANRLGFALHLALLRHPGFGRRHDDVVPDFLIRHLAAQLDIAPTAFEGYAHRAQTRLEHAWEAMERLRLRAFEAADVPARSAQPPARRKRPNGASRSPRQCWAICVLPGSFCPRPPVSSGSGWRGAPWRAASRPTRWSMRLLRSR